MLERNSAGGYRFRQSTLSAAQRCYRQAHYYATAAAQEQSSAMAYGTVVHHAIHVLERYRDLGQAQATFAHYWHPENLPELCDRGIDYWLPRQSYGVLRQRGLGAIKGYWELLRDDESQLLGLEYSFEVAVDDTIHTLGGTIDRLAVRYWNRKPYLEIGDFKTGKRPTYLRHNLQGHAYAYASTRPEFWTGFAAVGADPVKLWQQYRELPRRFRWIDLRDIKHVDGGWRSERDYARLKLAILELAALVDAGVYPMTLSGEACQYCPFRESCGGMGVAADTEGAPAVAGKVKR